MEGIASYLIARHARGVSRTTRYSAEAMSSTNVDRVRELIEAFNRRDFEAALSTLADDITWETFLSRTETEVLRGKEELRVAWESQVEAVDLRAEVEEIVAVGDDKVVTQTRMRMRGRGSEIDLVESVTWLAAMSEGLVQSVWMFEAREEAIAAASAPGP